MPSPAATDLLLVTGPPFSPPLWDGVRSRLSSFGLRSDTVDLSDTPSVQAAADAIADALQRAERPTALVAHGTAVPAALLAAARAPAAALAVTNGLTDRPDPVLAAIARLPGPLLSQLTLRPSVWLRWLTSSAGLRRAVINPYVMDRDMVVAVCHAPVSTGQRRNTTAAYLKDVATTRALPALFGGPVAAVWGDQDPLYPASAIDRLRQQMPHITHQSIPGGQHLHPIERPWALADALAEWLGRGSP